MATFQDYANTKNPNIFNSPGSAPQVRFQYASESGILYRGLADIEEGGFNEDFEGSTRYLRANIQQVFSHIDPIDSRFYPEDISGIAPKILEEMEDAACEAFRNPQKWLIEFPADVEGIELSGSVEFKPTFIFRVRAKYPIYQAPIPEDQVKDIESVTPISTSGGWTIFTVVSRVPIAEAFEILRARIAEITKNPEITD